MLTPAANDTVNVLLVACHQQTIDARVNALEIAGLTVGIMDVEVLAKGRALALLEKQLPGESLRTVAMVDIGASMTTLSVFADGESVYTREQFFGDKQLTDEIMNRYGLSFEEAGLAKKQQGLPEGIFYTVLNTTGNVVALEGVAESNNHVSSLMRRIDASEWLDSPRLDAVQSASQYGDQAATFKLTVTLLRSAVDQELPL